MLDIRLVRSNPDLVKENIKKKFQDEKLVLVDEVLELDKQFYYIDYSLAQMISLQFWALSMRDHKAAWEKYLAFVKQGGFRWKAMPASGPAP